MERPRPPIERPRAVILDADKTTVYPDFHNRAPGKVRRAIQASYAAGIPVTFNTGRWEGTYEGLFDGVGISVPMSVDYGSMIVAPDGSILWKKSANPDDVKSITSRLASISEIKPTIHYHSQILKEGEEVPPLSNVLDIECGGIPFDRKSALEQLAQEFPSLEHNIYNNRNGTLVFVSTPLANKGDGALMLAQVLGVPPEEIISAGDDLPDIPMFEVTGWSVAVGNAKKPVKNAADALVPSVYKNGVAHLLEEHVIKRIS